MINTGLGQGFSNAWNDCFALDVFPLLDFKAMTNGNNMFKGVRLNEDSWSDLLIDVEANNPNDGIIWSGGNSFHNVAGRDAKLALEARSWDITDDGFHEDFLITVTLTDEQIAFANVWQQSEPELEVISTLLEPFKIGDVFAALNAGTAVITERQRIGLNVWSRHDPSLNRVGLVDEPFNFGDILSEISEDPPHTTVLTQEQIERLNEWTEVDPGLAKVGTLTEPFLMGDFLNALLSRN